MSACEECWSLASWKVQILGGSVVDRYKEELARHPEHADEVIAEWARKEALLEAADIVHHHRFGKGQPLLSNSRLNQGVVDAECAIRALAEGEGQ